MMMLVNMCTRKSQSIIIKNLTIPTVKNLCFTTRRNHFRPPPMDSVDFRVSSLRRNQFRSHLDFSEFEISLSREIFGEDYKKFNKRPDSVLNLLNTFGFSENAILLLIRQYPCIFEDLDPLKDIMPKLNYLLYITRCESAVMSIVIQDPGLFSISLDSHLIPFFNVIKSVIGGYENAAKFLKDNVYFLCEYLTESFLLNIRFLLEVGVPSSHIAKRMKYHRKVSTKTHDEFRYAALKLKDLGFDFSSTCFYNCITPMIYLGDYGWETRCVLFKSFGFSYNQILSIFKRVPEFMSHDKFVIVEKLKFFRYKLHWTPLMLSSLPAVLVHSIEKWTRPRCSVLQVLVSKNNTSEAYMVSKILEMTDKKFLKNFVTAHKDEIPEVMIAYQGKLRFQKYTFQTEGMV